MKLTRGCRRMLRDLARGYRVVVERAPDPSEDVTGYRVHLYSIAGEHRRSWIYVLRMLEGAGFVEKSYGIGGNQAYYRLTQSGELRARRLRTRTR